MGAFTHKVIVQCWYCRNETETVYSRLGQKTVCYSCIREKHNEYSRKRRLAKKQLFMV